MNFDPGTTKKKLLLIEPDQLLLNVYVDLLEDHFEIACFLSLNELSQFLQSCEYSFTPDIVIAEILTPNEVENERSSSLSTLTWLEQFPVLIVTTIVDPTLVNRCLGTWATDYMTKPFNNYELITKCKLLANKELDVTGLPAKMAFRFRGRQTDTLTANEFRLLSYLSASLDRCVSVNQVTQDIWGVGNSLPRLHTLLSRLRPKIKPLGLHVSASKDENIVLEIRDER